VKKLKYESTISDRERILMNVCSQLAYELYCMQMSHQCRAYMDNASHSHRLKVLGGFSRDQTFKKGDVVMCMTSVWRQENPWLVSFVESVGIPNEPLGLVLRAFGTNQLCNYGNESFGKIVNLPENLMWEGPKRKFADKLSQTLRKMDTYIHRFRMVTFPAEGKADVMFGECFGGIGKKTMPYTIQLNYTPKTTLKEIKSQLLEKGFGTRKFEEVKPGESSFPNPQAITRESLVSHLASEGIAVKP